MRQAHQRARIRPVHPNGSVVRRLTNDCFGSEIRHFVSQDPWDDKPPPPRRGGPGGRRVLPLPG
ncbi:protein of unknown function [Streptomyces sp. KY75]|nr:protein of unknown function [Streptomyces sp. KY75]CAD5990474.1 protein of unknown function [Streptomyces sp. KY70]